MGAPQAHELDGDQAARAFTRLFESAPLGLALIDLAGRLFAVNPTLAETLGVGQASLHGRAVTDLVDPEAIERVQSSMSSLLRGDQETYSESRVYVRPDGTQVEMHVTVLLVRTEDREPQFALGVVEPREEIAELRARDQLARSVAHDLNNLLMVILAYGTSDNRVEGAAQRSVDLVRELLTGRAEPKLESLDVNDVVLAIKDIIEHLIGTTHAIELKLDPAAPVVVADRSGFERALANLVTNARDAMPGGGTVTIETHGGPETVEVAVSDTGVGVDPALVDCIFERDFTTKPPGVGHGIGLANVCSFARASGGDVRVERAPAGGARFVLTLRSR